MSIEQERWHTNGVMVWRGDAGVGVCVMHFMDEREGTFAPLPLEWQTKYATLIAKAPELAAGLRECANRFEAYYRHMSGDATMAAGVVARYRALLDEAVGSEAPQPNP